MRGPQKFDAKIQEVVGEATNTCFVINVNPFDVCVHDDMVFVLKGIKSDDQTAS